MAVGRYRKRPVEIDAIQFDGTNHAEIRGVLGAQFHAVSEEDRGDDPEIVAVVLERTHSTWVGVKNGQWIIQGTQGEHYPCDPEVFASTYEPVTRENK